MYEIIFLDEVGEKSRDTATSKETFDWKMSALKIAGATIIRSGKVNDTDRISPDDIVNDIHEFLNGGQVMNNEDENGGHGYIEHGSIGNAIVHVFYADDN